VGRQKNKVRAITRSRPPGDKVCQTSDGVPDEGRLGVGVAGAAAGSQEDGK